MRVRKLEQERGWAITVAATILKPTLLGATRRTWIDGTKIPAAGGKFLQPLPLLVHQQVHDGPDNSGHDDKGDVALGRFLHVVPATGPT